MTKALALFVAALTLTACQATVNSHTEINHYPSRTQERHPRGEVVFACTTVAAIYEYLENGGVSLGCGSIVMTAARYRSDFETYDGRQYRILEFRHGFNSYFTYEGRYWW